MCGKSEAVCTHVMQTSSTGTCKLWIMREKIILFYVDYRKIAVINRVEKNGCMCKDFCARKLENDVCQVYFWASSSKRFTDNTLRR